MEKIILVLIFFVIMFFKRKKQVGRTWCGPAKAEVLIKGKKLECPLCQNIEFNKREALLVTTWISMFRLIPLNQSACCFECRNCGYLQSFVNPKEEADVQIEK